METSTATTTSTTTPVGSTTTPPTGSVQLLHKRAGSPTSGNNTPSRFSFSADVPSPSASLSPAAALLHASLHNQTATMQQRQPTAATTTSSSSSTAGPQQVPQQHVMAATASSTVASPSRSSFSSSSPLSSPSLLGSSTVPASVGHINGQQGPSSIFTTSLPCSAVTASAPASSSIGSAPFSSSPSIYPPSSSAHQNLPSSCLMSPYAARPHNPSAALPTASVSRAPTASSTLNGFSTAGPASTATSQPQRSLSSSSGSLSTHQPQRSGSNSAPQQTTSSPSAAVAPSITSTDIGTIKHLLDAIESERLRKKRLEWYLQEVISEKEELVLAQQRKLLSGQQVDLVAQPETAIGGASSSAATKAQNAQNVLDGVDNYMFTKKRRLSFVSHSGSLGEALQPPLKKQSISLDDASIASFLSFQDDDLQALITAPSVPPQASASTSGGQQTTAASSSTTSMSSSSASEITIPPLIVNSTSLTPRRPSISFTPTGSLSLQSSNGSFSLSLPGAPPMSGSKGSLSSYSFSADPLACGWAMGYPQAETTPSQAGGGSSFCIQQLDPRISFDWNLWTNDDQLKETLTEFFDF